MKSQQQINLYNSRVNQMRSTKGIKETLYDEFREQGNSVSDSLELADKSYDNFIKELGADNA